MSDTALVFIDVETTGLDPERHQIWEIAYAVDGGPIVASVVDHDPSVVTASAAALDVGNYFNRGSLMAYRRSDLAQFETGLKKALNGATVVGANPAFDTAMLRARWGESPWNYRLLDVEAYAMPALHLERPRGLAFIAEQLGITAPDHTAEQDVRALRDCYLKLRDIYASAP